MKASTSPAGQPRGLAQRYTNDLAARLVTSLDLEHPPANEMVNIILSFALQHIQQDIASGRVVQLEHLGEFIKVANKDGPGIRYQPDRRLLERCCIENLKQHN